MAIMDAYGTIRNRHRDRDTVDLLTEAQCLRYDLAELETDAETDPASVRFLAESRAFLESQLTPIATELERRRRLRASVYAPPWPASWPDRRAEIDAVKAGISVEAFVESLTPTRLRRAGRQLVGLCPLHEEQTPSFYVDPAQGLWYCHGACKTGSDVIGLAMLFFGIDFPAALTFLAPIAGVERNLAGVGRG